MLLTTDQELVGCGAFNSTQVQEAKPADYSQLYTYGFHAGAQGGTSRKMEKGNANPEVLNSLLHEPVRGAIGLGRVPALDLPIYYVEGGLLPGYSGAPVVDADNRLVGIVEGGLDNGASAYNWVIPAANLKRLMVSQETLPARGFIKGAAHFSSPFIESGSTLRLAKEGQPDKPLYDFVSTKTRSLGQLASTSASPEDFEDLLAYGVEMGLDKTAAENLQFDLYEDVRKNLVIAIPTGQQPVFEPPKTVGAGTALRAGAADSRDGTLLFQEYPTEIFVPPNVSPIPPIQSDAFLKMVVDGQLRSCVTEFPWQHTCELIDSDTTPFPSGGALLKYRGSCACRKATARLLGIQELCRPRPHHVLCFGGHRPAQQRPHEPQAACEPGRRSDHHVRRHCGSGRSGRRPRQPNERLERASRNQSTCVS